MSDDDKDYLGTKIWGSEEEKSVRKNLLSKASKKLNIILAVSALWIFLITYGSGKNPPAAVINFFSNNKPIWIYFLIVYLTTYIFLVLIKKLKKKRLTKSSISENNEEIKDMLSHNLIDTCAIVTLIFSPIFYVTTFDYFANDLFPGISSKYNYCSFYFLSIEYKFVYFFRCLFS